MQCKKLCREIIEEVKKRKIKDQHKLSMLKLEILSKHKGIVEIPTNTDILSFATENERKELRQILTMKPTRTISGVAVAAVMTKPMKCPHGKCIMCPGGIDSVFGDVPQSYTGKEPATRRAIRNKYDAYLQVFNRLEQYAAMNQIPEKVELIIMGGTFPSFPKHYQESFAKDCFRAMNDFSSMFFSGNRFNFKKFKQFFEMPCDIGDKERVKRIHSKLLKLKKSKTTLNMSEMHGISEHAQEPTVLDKEQLKNEKSKIRCVALCIETRPDYAMLKHANQMLKLGCTRVELGVQTVYDDVLKKIERGHTVLDSIKATQTLKDLGFKINYHMMLGLPGVDEKKDLLSLQEIFANQNFKPDMLKLYPCMVVKGTKLYKLWKQKKYTPLTTEQAASIIAEFKRNVPVYCRIARVQRDIPTFMTEAGVDKTNLRQYVGKLIKERGIKCRCIRCREIGHKIKNEQINVDEKNVKLKTYEYDASDGKEFFLSVEDTKNDAIIALCRLRFPSKFLRKEITKDSALVRELHVYGETAEIGKKGLIQHRGYGKMLLKEAERISKQYDKNKIVVISGVGAREYYKNLSYKREGVYMVKKL